MNRDISPSTIGTLLSELRDEGTTLLRQETALAKAELGEKLSLVGKSVAAMAVGGVVVGAGLIILLIGVGYLARHALVAAGLDDNIAQWLGFLLVGAVVAVVGWVLLAKAKKNLNAKTLQPTETVASLRDSKQWAQSKLPHAHEPAH